MTSGNEPFSATMVRSPPIPSSDAFGPAYGTPIGSSVKRASGGSTVNRTINDPIGRGPGPAFDFVGASEASAELIVGSDFLSSSLVFESDFATGPPDDRL